MPDSFRIYKGENVVLEGVSPLEITGVGPDTSVAAGEYQVTRVVEDQESAKVDIPAFQTLPIAVTGVSVDPATAELEEGATQQLTETISPSNATDKGVTWSSSDEAVATVDSNGLVTAVAEGNATITVTTNDGSFTASCDVTVTVPVG
ncbi:Ig-like domain-containing protein [Virgibacillus salarius]